MGTTVVTGASSGLGREIALQLAARGERVVAVARSRSALEELAATSSSITPLVADLATTAGRDAVVEGAGEVDTLVNNAGFGALGKVAETPVSVLDEMVEVNVAALTDLTARLVPGMVARGRGRVLNIASTAAFQPGPNMAVYFATKAYVLSFTEALAHELRGTGVSATAFCPGAFASGFQRTAGAEKMRLVSRFKLPGSAEIARAAISAMDKGAVVAVPGLVNRLGTASVRFAPRSLVRSLSAWVASEG